MRSKKQLNVLAPHGASLYEWRSAGSRVRIVKMKSSGLLEAQVHLGHGNWGEITSCHTLCEQILKLAGVSWEE